MVIILVVAMEVLLLLGVVTAQAVQIAIPLKIECSTVVKSKNWKTLVLIFIH
jgi:hypothetical protein